MVLNDEQQRVYDAIISEQSVVLTGAGGVGKTHLLNEVVSYAKSNNIAYGVTATTGTAAILLNGTTIHSFLGIGLGAKPAKELVRDLLRKNEYGRKTYEKIQRLKLLIIDEMSMLNDVLFDLISEYLSIIKKVSIPFGGVQLVLSGDMFQIPPVTGNFFFKSKTWEAMTSIQIFELQKSQRHKDDRVFNDILSNLRRGACGDDALQELKKTETNVLEGGIKPSLLYLKNIDVNVVNAYELDKLLDAGAIPYTYNISYSRHPAAKAWAASAKLQETTKLCVGAQVMLKWNVDLENGLCNGSRGVVVGFTETGVSVLFRNGTTHVIEHIKIEHPDDATIWFRFMPLRLAWALTINVSQGATLDAAIIDMDVGNISADFLYGKFYTAISRVRDLNSLVVRNASKHLFKAHPDVIEFVTMNKLGKLSI